MHLFRQINQIFVLTRSNLLCKRILLAVIFILVGFVLIRLLLLIKCIGNYMFATVILFRSWFYFILIVLIKSISQNDFLLFSWLIKWGGFFKFLLILWFSRRILFFIILENIKSILLYYLFRGVVLKCIFLNYFSLFRALIFLFESILNFFNFSPYISADWLFSLLLCELCVFYNSSQISSLESFALSLC